RNGKPHKRPALTATAMSRQAKPWPQHTNGPESAIRTPKSEIAMADAHSQNGHDHSPAHDHAPTSFQDRILRPDGPGQPRDWERHQVAYERDMHVISVLQRVAAKATTSDGKHVAPVAWDCNCLEEVCGACTMVINGQVRQSCSALVDKLLAERPGEIELAPMSKFPVLRDLLVDRSRLFRALQKVKAWIPADGYYDQGPGQRLSQAKQEAMYPLSECMSCGCCLDACPQYLKIEVERLEGETDEAYQKRKEAEYDHGF